MPGTVGLPAPPGVAVDPSAASQAPAIPPAVPLSGNTGASDGADGGATGTSFVGQVKLFNMQKGWGMIACDKTQQMYGKDVFFMKSAVPGGYIEQGERVRFSIRMEPKGPVAISVQPMYSSGPGGGAPYGGMAHWGAMARYGMPPWAYGQWGGMGPWAMFGMPGSNQLYFGTVLSFNEEKGWGFIRCDATMQLYRKDVFVMRGALKRQTIAKDDLVSFKVEIGMKGPQASDVTLLPVGSISSDGQGRQFTGRVKMFDAEKGWGFIEGEGLQQVFGKDIFLHKRELDDRAPAVGEEVRFRVSLDNNGQPQAKGAEVVTIAAV